MKKFTFIVSALLVFQLSASSQLCLPEGITFTTQVEIDNFQSNHPYCIEIQGDVFINGDDITNLNGLNVLTSITGNLLIGGPFVFGNNALTSLTGLENVTSIGGTLWIRYNGALTSLTGLDNVTSIWGDIWINGNATLTSLSGLDNMDSIGGDLEIYDNDALTCLTGLDNVISIGGDLSVMGNDLLTSLIGLENVASIDGMLHIGYNSIMTSLSELDNVASIGGSLRIYNNSSLISLEGLGNINSLSIMELEIFNNPSLSTCEVQSVCDFLATPTGTIQISLNATGCNSQEEVEAVCLTVSTENLETKDCLLIYPNPIFSYATIEYQLKEPAWVSLIIINHLGQQVETLINQHQLTGRHQIIWNAKGLPAGIYFFRLLIGEQSQTGKMVVTN